MPLPRSHATAQVGGVRRATTPPLHRARLVSTIELAVRSDRVVVVAGPPRSGVSTLVTDWADRTALLVDHTVTVPGRLRQVADDDPAGRHVLLVDDAHLLGVAGTTALLASAAERPVVLAGRAGPALDAVAAEARTAVIGTGDLAFDAAETAALLGRAVGVVIAPAFVARTTADVGGLAGVLAEAATALADEDRPPVDLAARFDRAAASATRTWVGQTVQEPWLRSFAERAAVVPSAPAEFLAELGGDTGTEFGGGTGTDLGAVHRAAADAGLGRLDGDGFAWFDGIARALRASGASTDADRHREVVRRAAAWAITHDDTVTAIDAAVQLDDLDLLSDVLTTAWTRITGPGAPAIAQLLDPIRPKRAARHPVVLAAIARSESAADRHHARASRVNAAVIPAVAAVLPTVPSADAVFLAAIDAQARRIVGDDVGAVAAATTARIRLDALDATAADRLAPRLPFVLQQIAATELAAGDGEGALATLARIEPVEGADGDLQRAAAEGLTALVHALGGEVDVARRLLDGGRPLDVPTGALATAIAALEHGDPDDVQQILRRVDPLFGAFEHWPIVLAVRARASTVAGRVPPEDQLTAHDAGVQRYRQRSTAGGVGARMLALARVRLQLAAGQLSQAERGLEALGTVQVWNAAEHMGLALARSEPERALAIVNAVAVHGVYQARTTALLVLLRAVALRRTGDVLAAVAAFREAMDLFDRHGLRGELLTPPRDDVRQLVDASGDERAQALWESLSGLRSVFPGPDVGVVLSERESVVLGLLGEPLSVPGIASELHVSVNTVKTQVRSVYRKLGVSTRREAVEQGRSLGLSGA